MGGAEASIDEAGRWPLSASQGVWIFSLLAGCFLALYFSFFGRTPSRVGATQGARILSLLAGCYPALYLCFLLLDRASTLFLPFSLPFSLSPSTLPFLSLFLPLFFFFVFLLLCHSNFLYLTSLSPPLFFSSSSSLFFAFFFLFLVNLAISFYRELREAD